MEDLKNHILLTEPIIFIDVSSIFSQFWSALSPQARHELLRIDKQTLIEHARRNLYCSRCNGLLLESFTQMVMHGKLLQQKGPGVVQDDSWGGLSTTKDGLLTLLDCFINTNSLHVLQNVSLNNTLWFYTFLFFYLFLLG
jgi:hypothetical protein